MVELRGVAPRSGPANNTLVYIHSPQEDNTDMGLLAGERKTQFIKISKSLSVCNLAAQAPKLKK
jgi:hypothetical protein